MAETIPLVHLSKAYSSSIYKKGEDLIHFEVSSHKTSITKPHFSKLLGIPLHEVHVVHESISTSSLIEMFYQMGYTCDISLLSKFRKPFFPPMRNGLFTLLFKNFSERVASLDSTSKFFYTLIYGLFHGVNLDYGSVLWAQIIQSTISSTRHTEISCA